MPGGFRARACVIATLLAAPSVVGYGVAVRLAADASETSRPPSMRPRVREIAPERNVLKTFGSKDWSAARLLHDCFGGPTMTYLATLRSPELNSNVFFRPLAPAVVAAVEASEAELPSSLRNDLAGCAQLLRVRLREAAGEGTEGSRPAVAYIQSVAVDEALRRRGIARELIRWCEARAIEQWRGDQAVDEVWLAVAEVNAAALALYASLGYERRRVVMGNVLMRKQLVHQRPPPQRSSGIGDGVRMSIESGGSGGSGGVGLKPLLANVGVQALYASVAALGVSLLLVPFGGPSVASLLGTAGLWEIPNSFEFVGFRGSGDSGGSGSGVLLAVRGLAECALGAGVASVELARQGVLNELFASAANDKTGGKTGGEGEGGDAAAQGPQLEYTRAQADQMRPLYEISAGEGAVPVALGAIAAWQLAIGVAEELYYRGFVESLGVRVLAPPAALIGDGAGLALREGFPLLVSAALFGLVHAEFVEGAGAAPGGDEYAADTRSSLPPPTPSSLSRVEDTKAFWFRVTALYGALYGALYIATGHRLLAPVFAHTGLNVGLCMRDWQRMRRTPEEVLTCVFDPPGQGGVATTSTTATETDAEDTEAPAAAP